jgi:hypothetical protein
MGRRQPPNASGQTPPSHRSGRGGAAKQLASSLMAYASSAVFAGYLPGQRLVTHLTGREADMVGGLVRNR